MRRPASVLGSLLALLTAASPALGQTARVAAAQSRGFGAPVAPAALLPAFSALPTGPAPGFLFTNALPGLPPADILLPVQAALAAPAAQEGPSLAPLEAPGAVPLLSGLQQTGALPQDERTPLAEASRLGSVLFDRASVRGASPEAEPVPVASERTHQPLARTIGPSQEAGRLAPEPHGGPRPERDGALKETLGRIASHVGQGLLWGFNMIGLLAAVNGLQWLVLIAYQHYTGSPLDVHVIGKMDPTLEGAFGTDLTQHPWVFLFQTMTEQIVREEVHWRLLAFGAVLLPLAAVGPIVRWMGRAVSGKSPGRVRAWLGRQIGRSDFLSRRAFPLAALAAALGFAAVHLPAWNPEFYAWLQALWAAPTQETLALIKVPAAAAAAAGILLRAAFAYAMARLVYKTRGLLAPIVAHWVFNAVQFLAAVLVLNLGLAPVHSEAYFITLLLLGGAVGLFNLRRALQDRKAARSGYTLE